jgi:predicted metal-dependent hydrolase
MLRVIDTWEIPSVGCVIVEKSDRARYTRITLKRDGTVKLTVPRTVALEQARRFLESRLSWIRQHTRQFRQLDTLPVGRAEARRLLIGRVHELAQAHGFLYNKVSIKSQRTLWGSCSARNNINLNINLLRLPADLRDYVILHELVHTRHKNHSKAFWRELDRLVGNARQFQRNLRAYRLGD